MHGLRFASLNRVWDSALQYHGLIMVMPFSFERQSQCGQDGRNIDDRPTCLTVRLINLYQK